MAPLNVLSHRPAPEISEKQTLVTTGIEDAITAAREVAGDKDVSVMGGGALTSALAAGLVDEVVLHQVPSCWAAATRSSGSCPHTCGSGCSRPSRHRA